MKISVSGKKMDVGQALSDHVKTTMNAIVGKYFDRAIDANVVFGKEAHMIFSDIHVNEGTGTGVIIKAQGREGDAYAAFDRAAERVEKQLRRYKRRLKNHHQSPEIKEAVKYILPDNDEEEAADHDENPLIVAEKPTKIEKLTVSDAVMRMNLAHLPALMFIDKKNGKVAVVYKRHDGNISWVNSGITAN
jgi:ribosomal subunit interface protein